VPKAEKALKSAPGVLAVQVDFDTRQATVGTKKGTDVPAREMVTALESIGYGGEVVRQPPEGARQ